MRTLPTLAITLALFAGAAGAAPLPPQGGVGAGAACTRPSGFHATAYRPGAPTPSLACCQDRMGCARFLSTRTLVHGPRALRT